MLVVVKELVAVLLAIRWRVVVRALCSKPFFGAFSAVRLRVEVRTVVVVVLRVVLRAKDVAVHAVHAAASVAPIRSFVEVAVTAIFVVGEAEVVDVAVSVAVSTVSVRVVTRVAAAVKRRFDRLAQR